MIYLQRIASIFSDFALATPVHRWVQFHAQRSSSTAARRDSRTTRRSVKSGPFYRKHSASAPAGDLDCRDCYDAGASVPAVGSSLHAPVGELNEGILS